MPGAADVFISYNSADKAWAEWIAWTLEENGYSVVIQAWDFRPGGNFVLAMNEATKCDVTMAVLSPSYLEADFPQAEWAAAFVKDPRGRDGKLIPVRVRDCQLDGLLGPMTYVDLVGRAEKEAARALIQAFAKRAKPPSKPDFPGGPPRERPAFPAREPRIATSRLPATGETFVAREDELKRLDDASIGWATRAT